MIYLLMSIKLWTTLKSPLSFFLKGNFILAPHGLLFLMMILASSMTRNISLAKSRSLVIYLRAFFFIGFASLVRSIECLNKSVAWRFFTDSAKQFFHVYTSFSAFLTRSGVSALGPIIIPLDAHKSWITWSGAELRFCYCGRRCVGNSLPFPRAYLEICGANIDRNPFRSIGGAAFV